jgi:hypothetical protein
MNSVRRNCSNELNRIRTLPTRRLTTGCSADNESIDAAAITAARGSVLSAPVQPKLSNVRY